MFKTLAVMSFSILAVTAASAFAGSVDCKNANQFKEINKKELTDLIQKKAVFVIDVNSTESFNTHHIPTAIHYADHKADLAQVLPPDPNALIVAYCGGTQCEAWKEAATDACTKGHTNIRHFKPGITGWVADSGAKVEKGTAAAPTQTQ